MLLTPPFAELLPGLASNRAANLPQITLYQDWLARERGLRFDSYDALWRWSVADLPAFWQSIWDYFDLQSPTPHSQVLASAAMPGAQWFVGAQVNYAAQVLRHVPAAAAAGLPAIIARNELGAHTELSWPELARQVASLALRLEALGVQPGDRVAAYLPNVPEAMVAFLACASVGAVWSLCAPDMGTRAVLDRFAQITPRVLIGCDAVHYAGKTQERSAVLQELQAALPTVEHVIVLSTVVLSTIERNSESGKSQVTIYSCQSWRYSELIADDSAAVHAFTPRCLAFDHPLWIVYSSGTTGLPKAIVHGHGGIVMVALALKTLHNDIGCSYDPNTFGERFHWYSSTGWVMWNAQLAGLLNGTTLCLYDGSPSGSKESPDWTVLWRFAAELGVTFFGAGSAFFASCLKAGVELRQCGDLSRVRALGATGSPLSADSMQWGTQQFEQLGTPNIWWCVISGGTDFAGAFIGGNRNLPQVAGEMQCRLLGCAVEAWDEEGKPVVGTVGELVCTAPIPSMPLYFWGDAGNKRLISSYFDTYPGVWRHGDWLMITERGSCIIYGRSDATINRYGLRLGTSEIYRAVEALPEVQDSLVIDLEYLGKDSELLLFVQLLPNLALEAPLIDALTQRLHAAIRLEVSPRFIPNSVHIVPEVPRTLSGKKQELPIKKLLLGHTLDKVLSRDTMANPASLEWFIRFAASRANALL